MHHPSPFASKLPAHKARTLLANQLSRLNEVVANSDRPDLVAHAHSYARKVSIWLEQSDDTLSRMAGRFGENGHGPAVDAICREASHREPVRFVDEVSERRAA